jgi:MTH538 TIR-like domain (DUF1863)
VPPAQPTAFLYKAFLSYSHEADSALAGELQHSLQQFAKPYYVRRAISVFRDQTDLGANPGLWSRIAEMLDASEYLLLLASPSATQSRWVKREIDHWLTAHGGRPTNVLLMWTDGILEWDHAQNDFDWSRTDALPRLLDWDLDQTPRSLEGVFPEEPFFIDLRRWRTESSGYSVRDPMFLDYVATITAELRGEVKSALIGRDVREHERFRKIRAGAIAAICIFALAATVFGVVALLRQRAAQQAQTLAEQRLAETNTARAKEMEALKTAEEQKILADQRTIEAERQRNIAIWQAAALQASRDALNRNDDDRAALLAREALRMHGLTPDQPWYLVETALQNAAEPHIFSHVLLGHTGGVDEVAYSRDGSRIASSSNEDRTIQIWKTSNPTAASIVVPIRQHVPPNYVGGPSAGFPLAPTIPSVALSVDGNLLAWTTDPCCDQAGVIALLDLRHPEHPATVLFSRKNLSGSVAFAPDTGFLVAGVDAGVFGSLRFWDPQHLDRPPVLSKAAVRR